VQQRPGDCGALEQPAAEPARRVVRPLAEPRHLERSPGGVTRAGEAIETRDEGQVLEHGQVVVQQGLVRQEADRAASLGRLAGERPAEHVDFARGRAHEARQDPEQRALPRPIRPGDGQRLAGGQGQVDVVKDPKAAE
jgi:hypothetical protein